jgi:ribonuclease P protein component
MSLTSRASFPGTARLRSPAEFAPALKGRRLARGALFVLSVAPAGADATMADPAAAPQARLGLVIGKRYAPLSVSRNAIKRVIREAFRHKRLALPAGDYVVRLHTRIPSVSLTALKHMTRLEMDGHWLRAARAGRADRPPEPRPRAVDNAVTPDKGAERDGTRV